MLPDDSIAIGGTFSVGIGQFGIGEPAYTTLSPSSTAPEAFVARLRADTGNLFWAKMPVGGSTEAVSQVVALRDGDIGVAGTFLSTALTFGPGEGGQTILTNPGGTATADMFIAKFSRADGALQWAKSGGGTGTETVQAMTMLASNSAVVVGSFQPVSATFGNGETRQTVLTNAESTGTNTDLYIARFNAGGVSPPSAPLVNPLAASGLSSSTITFNVSVDSQGADTTVVVDYGPTTAYGSSATLTLVSAGVAPETRSFTLTGLSPLSTTNFRVTATNAQGSNVTNNVAVTTYTDAEVEVEESAAVLVDGAATVNFAGVGVGTSSMKTFTIRNVSGTGTLLSLSRSVDGGAAANFVASALGVTTLSPGASTTITVTYMPTVPGPRSAALHIVSNDGDESPFDINLTGDNFLATTFNSASDVPITANGYTVPTGRTLTLQLNFAPSAGTLLKVIDNTSGNPISGTFYGLPQNGIIAASFGGQTYYFQASYSGGDGNDLVLGETLEWTWMKGLGVNSTGSAGTQGTPSGTTFPGSRQGASSWTDATGNLWLLGGNGISTTSQSGYLNDLWKYNKATNQWVWLKGSTTTTNVNGVYGTQGVAASTNAPGARQVGTTWVDGAGILWLFGGFGYPATGTTQGYLNDLWKYDPATNNWTWMGGSTAINTNGTYGTQGTAAAGNIPGGRWSSFRWIDGSGNLWLFGGQGYPATGTTVGSLNDLWKYDPVANQWTWMKGGSAIDTFAVHGTKGVEAGTNMPGGRYGTAGWKDAQGRFWLFAGFGVNTSAPGRLADVWRYDPATNNWTWMNGPIPVNANGAYGLPGVADATNQPGGRWDPAAWIDTLGRVWVFGGSGIGATTSTVGDLADLWTYDPATSLWTFIRGSTAINTLGSYVALGTPLPGSAPGGRERISSFHASGAVSDVWMFGGLGFGVTGTTAGNICDLWTLDLPGAPVVSTSAPSPVSAIAATLRATVSTNNFATTVRFKWGTSPTLAGATTTADQVIASGSGVLVTQAITGLNFSTTYYCQVIADNFAGTASGSILSFATPAASDIVIEQPAGFVLADGAVVDIGSAGIAAAASKTFTLKNLGTAALSINPPTIDGTHASDFVVGSLPSSLAVSGSTTFTVTFTPSTTGARSATLHIASNDPDESPFDINLTGTGLTAYQAAQQAAGITGTADPDGDEDSDGIRNAMEVAFGTDPGSSGSGTSALVHTGGFAGGGAISSRGQPIVEQEPAPNTVDLRAVFVRRKDAAALGITYTVQFSADMITWQSSTVIPTVLADDGTYQIVSVPYPFFIGKKKARFFHVVISISP